MALEKREKRTVLVIGLIVVAAAACWGMWNVHLHVQEDAIKAEHRQANKHVKMGETISLNSYEDREGTPSDPGYVAEFDWDGTLEFTVESAEFYGDVESLVAEHPSVSASMERARAHKYPGYLACRIIVNNVDAVPWDTTRAGTPGFFMSSWRIGPPLYGDSEGFDGTAPNAEARELFIYALPQGSQETYTVVYGLEEGLVDGQLPDSDPFLYITGHNLQSKYRIYLNDIQDKR